jgi:hypothetical protein
MSKLIEKALSKHLQYAGYVLRHKYFVMIECIKLGIVWRGITHDLSKLLPDEWFPYVEYFYGDDESDDVKQAFDQAWLRHIHRNPHHWQFWLLQEDEGELKRLPMPLDVLKEMLADWRGAGKAQGFDEIGTWYAKNRDRIVLAEGTRIRLHAMMESWENLPVTLEAEEV